MEDPSSSVLEGVTDVPATVETAINNIDNPEVSGPKGDTRLLTAIRDNLEGTSGDDEFFAEPASGENGFIQTLQAFDSIDGGDGMDVLTVYDVAEGAADFDLRIETDQVKSIEKLIINAQEGVRADTSDWVGLESIELERFDGKIDIKTAGASVTFKEGEGIGQDYSAKIDGAGGELSINAHWSAPIDIITRGHTTSVSVDGGSDIDIDGNGRGGYSESLTAVSVDGVAQSGWRSDGDDVRISSDALENLTLTGNFGAATVNYETVGELTLNVGAFGGRHAWDGRNLSTREGKLALVAEDADESVIEKLNVNVAAASQLALTSDVKHLNVSGTAALNVQLDEFVDESGAWVLLPAESGKEENVTVGKQYVIAATDGSGDYWTTLNGKLLGLPVGMATPGALAAVARPNFSDDGGTDDPVTESLETITVSGAAGLTINATAQEDLASVDASGSSGRNSFTLAATNDLTAITTGSGNDTVTLSGTYAATGLKVELGGGDDTFAVGSSATSTLSPNSSVGAATSMVDGGTGTDTLWMRTGEDSTAHVFEGEDGEDHSIYIGFETLDVGGGSGTYDFGILGVETLQVTRGTSTSTAANARVILNNVTPGTAINVTGNNRMLSKDQTEAKMRYNLAEREAGSFRFGDDSNLDVNLLAVGRSTDVTDDRSTPGVDEKEDNNNGASNVTLDLVADANIQGMMIDSSAQTGGTALASDYTNTICLQADGLVEVKITGNAKLVFKDQDVDVAMADPGSGVTLSDLELVDARENTGGVTIYAQDGGGRSIDHDGDSGTPDVNTVIILGTNAVDTIYGSRVTAPSNVANVLQGFGGGDRLNGGDGDDVFIGGTGGDMLNLGFDDNPAPDVENFVGTGGSDRFRYESVADSQLVVINGRPFGIDTIHNFTTGDSIRLSESLLANANSRVKLSGTSVSGPNEFAGGVNFAITEDTTDDAPNSLLALINDQRDGFFETRANLTVTKSFMAIVNQSDAGATQTARYLFIDVNGSGDFEAQDDMIIRLAGADTAAITVDAIS